MQRLEGSRDWMHDEGLATIVLEIVSPGVYRLKDTAARPWADMPQVTEETVVEFLALVEKEVEIENRYRIKVGNFRAVLHDVEGKKIDIRFDMDTALDQVKRIRGAVETFQQRSSPIGPALEGPKKYG